MVEKNGDIFFELVHPIDDRIVFVHFLFELLQTICDQLVVPD